MIVSALDKPPNMAMRRSSLCRRVCIMHVGVHAMQSVLRHFSLQMRTACIIRPAPTSDSNLFSRSLQLLDFYRDSSDCNQQTATNRAFLYVRACLMHDLVWEKPSSLLPSAGFLLWLLHPLIYLGHALHQTGIFSWGTIRLKLSLSCSGGSKCKSNNSSSKQAGGPILVFLGNSWYAKCLPRVCASQ